MSSPTLFTGSGTEQLLAPPPSQDDSKGEHFESIQVYGHTVPNAPHPLRTHSGQEAVPVVQLKALTKKDFR